MKKTLKLFGLAALAAIAFSCTKKDDPFTPGTPTDQTTPAEGQTEEPAVIPATDGGVLTSFGATVGSEATKVTVDLTNGTIDIEPGDQVLVVDSEGNSAIYVYDFDQSKFVLRGDQKAVTVNTATGVYYPYTETETESEYEVVGSTVRMKLPAGIAADGDFGAINPMAGVITGDETKGYSVKLKSITSVLRVKVTAGVNINSVTLDFGDGNNYADGAEFTVDPSASTLTFVDGTCPENPATVNVSADAADVLFFLPTVYLTDGLTVTANLASNHNGGTNSFSLSKAAYKPAVNKISTMSFYAGLFSGGAGTSNDPYKIANARDFKHISEYCKNGYGEIEAASFLSANTYYKQTKDIDFKNGDLSGYMIASPSAAFSGTYDGNNKTLSNYSITHTPTQGDKDGAALFQNVEGGVLQNISISGANVSGGKFTAGLVGYAKACTITGCSIENSTISSGVNYGGGGLIGGLYAEAADSETSTVTGCSAKDITFTNTGSGQHFGGLISYINGVVTVRGCSVDGAITVNGTPNYFGGIVSQINDEETQITDCENHSTISGVGNYAGGIVGQKSIGAIEGCTNDGSISGAQYVGGIVGTNSAGAILGCTNTGKGTITSSSGDAGGIAGQVTGGTVKTCKNSGNVNASGSNTGGIAGSQSGGSEILECWSNAQITGRYQTGGIVGNLNDFGAVVRCTAKGDVSGTQCVGGIVGHAYASNTENARGILVMECLSKANVTASTGTNSNSGGVIGRLHSNRVSGGSIQWANVFQCVGWSATIKNTNTDACTRFGAFVGFLNTEYGKTASTQARCQVRNSYTTVATDHMIWLAGKPSSTGGFVGELQRGRFHACYYQLDNNTQSAKESNNLVTLEKFTKVDNDFATYLMSNLETTADNNYTGNGKSYSASAWTMTGYESEALDYPLPSALVALGTEYYR